MSNPVCTLGRKCGLSLALHPKYVHVGHGRERNLDFGLWEWDTEYEKEQKVM